MNTLKSITGWIGAATVCLTLFSLPSRAQESTKLTDPEIASVAVTANQIDVNYGKIALDRSKNADIRKFAQTMIKDHTSIIAQAVALAKKLGVTPQKNDLTQQLQHGELKTSKALKSKKGKDFDKAYIDNEVAYHEAVINAVKNVLIPQTQNQELKNLLQQVVPLLNEHLEMAKDAQVKF